MSQCQGSSVDVGVFTTITMQGLPARGRCVWSRSELARQTYSARLHRSGNWTEDECQTNLHLYEHGVARAQCPTCNSILQIA